MAWGGWKKIGNFGKSLGTAKGLGNTLGAGVGGLVSPIAYLGGLQQGGWKGGMAAMEGSAGNASEWWSDPGNRSMMALTTAEIAAIVATGGIAGGMTIGGYAAGGSVLGATALGSTTAAIAGASALALQSKNIQGGSGAGEIPPDLQDTYKNDPEQAKQFMRLRKSAAMLGRAGTIKAKGSASLGGDQPLGTNLALTGA